MGFFRDASDHEKAQQIHRCSGPSGTKIEIMYFISEAIKI